MRYAGICFVSDQVPTLTRFYSDVFRAQAEGDDTHAVIKLDGTPLTLFSRQGMEGMAPGCMKGAGCGCCVIEFWVEDVDAEHERLKAMGVEIVKPPISYPWGTRSVWFRDPDGNVVNFKCWVSQPT